MAMASAGVIAASPVAPTLPALPDIQARAAHAVELAAATNPLIVWQQTITETMGSLQNLGVGISEAVPALLQGISNPEIYLEFVNIVALNTLNPVPLLTELVNFPANYGGVINTAFTDTLERMTTTAAMLPEVVFNTLRYLAAGQFVEAFAEADVYFVLNVLGAMRPLIPLFSIPSEFVASLPGAERLPALLDVVSEFAITKAAIAPFLTAVAQTAEIFDATRIALAAGDVPSAVVELVNLPAKVFNAFVNGYTPGFATGAWPGIINGGIVDYLTVTLPKQIADALTGPVEAANSIAAQGAPTEFNLDAETVTVNLASREGVSGTTNNGSGDGTVSGAAESDDVIDEEVTDDDVTDEQVTEDDVTEDGATEDGATEDDATDEDATDDVTDEDDAADDDATDDDATDDVTDEDDAADDDSTGDDDSDSDSDSSGSDSSAGSGSDS
ncbi:hypothetical protein ABQE93_22080 [Mycolicibacterium sp. XJ662]